MLTRGASVVLAAVGFALAGAATGSAIGDTSVKYRSDHTYIKPQPQMIRQSSVRVASSERRPDHYPIETPQGRFEVHELRERGLYRNARYSHDAPIYDGPDFIPVDGYTGADRYDAVRAPRATLAVEPEMTAGVVDRKPAHTIVVHRGSNASVATIEAAKTMPDPGKPRKQIFQTGSTQMANSAARDRSPETDTAS
ncbi:hypothetical protein [Erythrobacter litoralis]|uniref:Uncharacterized protein n=1 Tax=Erythrobacter litoralis (strain HTCC2594) TaxID=314225 RepID=Q2N8F3_ERYLH|nr:hypothetical protein [Erythrobacter litoralis]ABC64038.1 hypothetical protein ELI_09730 [Erythrobacter litoralis HTCC2594]